MILQKYSDELKLVLSDEITRFMHVGKWIKSGELFCLILIGFAKLILVFGRDKILPSDNLLSLFEIFITLL